MIRANQLGIAITRVLRCYDRPVQLLDTNQLKVQLTNWEGMNAVFGNTFEEDTLESLRAEEVATNLAIRSNSEVNVISCQFASDSSGIEGANPVLTNPAKGANPKSLRQTGGRLAFGCFLNLSDWEFSQNPFLEIEWKIPTKWTTSIVSDLEIPKDVLPVIRMRAGDAEIVHVDQLWHPGALVILFSRLRKNKQGLL